MKSGVVSLLLLALAMLVIPIMVLGSLSCGTAGGGTIATVQDMQVSRSPQNVASLQIHLKPTSSARANILYWVDLYQYDQIRSSTSVWWDQIQLEAQATALAEFTISVTEFQAYNGTDLSQIFSVKVHE